MSTVTIIVVSLLKTLSQYNSNIVLLSLTWKISSSSENYQMDRALKTLIFLTISI